ncbi:zonula occludens toxin [Beggiatoa alba B18LD]|uniref:Zonula occludens toxin n=1 Tax=Beggiatoa alba B18LD TaxID=395493 RepID=I3CFH0_9GAMM|nr:zonular occludens toxin domain-containing protein [Beggiatoa alba]EIJ42363.1 zonula occludens toxin [Beggiatoa alba B18LD]
MSVVAVCGLPRHGKSYQVCSKFIPEALLGGRDVVTNIVLLEDNIRKYLIEEKGANPDKLGRVRYFKTEDVFDSLFFPTEDNQGKGCFIHAGDLVVIDEVWKYFDTGVKVSREALAFLRYHGHFKHAQTGITCDVILITQDVTSLPRSVKNLIELTIHITKLVEAGLRNAFVIRHFQQTTIQGRNAVKLGEDRSIFDKRFFAFYKSHDGDVDVKANELIVDKRQVIWNSKFFKFAMPLVALMFIGGLFVFYRIIAGLEDKAKASNEPILEPASVSASNQSGVTRTRLQKPQKPEKPVYSGASILGHYTVGNDLYVWIVQDNRPRLLINPLNFRIYNMRLEGSYKGEILDSFSGERYHLDDDDGGGTTLDLKVPSLK